MIGEREQQLRDDAIKKTEREESTKKEKRLLFTNIFDFQTDWTDLHFALECNKRRIGS
jgi:hypothetical protein